MHYLVLITPILLFTGSAVFAFRSRSTIAYVMCAGFLCLMMSVLIPFFMPVSSVEELQQQTKLIKLVANIGSFGSLAGSLAFVVLAFVQPRVRAD